MWVVAILTSMERFSGRVVTSPGTGSGDLSLLFEFVSFELTTKEAMKAYLSNEQFSILVVL